MQVQIKAALALASLTSRVSACTLIANLPDNKDTRMFGFLLGLDRPEALPDEIIIALWALSNIAALDANTENKFLEVDFLLDRLGRCAATGTSEEHKGRGDPSPFATSLCLLEFSDWEKFRPAGPFFFPTIPGNVPAVFPLPIQLPPMFVSHQGPSQ